MRGMRTMFAIWTSLLALGIVTYTVIGLTHG